MLPSRMAAPQQIPALASSRRVSPPILRLVRRTGRAVRACALITMLLPAAVDDLAAQSLEPGIGSTDRLRFGLTIGGTSFLGLTSEYQWGDWSAELTVGTIGFRDLSLALAGKHYFSSGRLRPAAGIGMWNISVWSEEGSGSALLARVPLAVDWAVSGGHAFGVEVGLNRALWIRRIDPEDDTPARSNIVPFPALYYRHGWDR